MKVACVVYPDCTALDFVGPIEVISRWPDTEVHFVASEPGQVRTDCGLTVIPTDTTESMTDPDLIVVPGSGNPLPVLSDQVLIDWLAATGPKCQWTASVCTGAGLYAAAGLLEGKKTSTHWAFRDVVRAYGPEVVTDRVVWQGNHISAAGVSAGIDMALTLSERVHGRELAEALQLVIEYDPQPPFDTGSLEKAGTGMERRAMEVMMSSAGYTRMQVVAKMGRAVMRARLTRARRALSGRRRASGRGQIGAAESDRGDYASR
jgi:transcriptional regulator GlxA family with amidase domain